MTFWKASAAALGITMLFEFRVAEPLLDPRHIAVYHWSASASDLFVPVMLDFLLCWTLLVAVILIADGRKRLRLAVWLGVLLLTPWILVKTLPVFYPGSTFHLLGSHLLYIAALLYAIILILWRDAWEPVVNHCIHFAQTVFCFGSACAVLMLLQLGFYGFEARGLNIKPTLLPRHVAAAARQERGRIIWIVFDELSHNQVYESRYPGISLPAFDALAAQATVFTQVVPAGMYTERILPSLMTGKAVADMQSSPAGSLVTRPDKTERWSRFNPHDTVFQDALDRGYNTGIVGWFNPYCRTLAPVLHECRWMYGTPLDSGLTPGASLAHNTLQPLVAVADNDRLLHFATNLVGLTDSHTLNSRGHTVDYKGLLESADKLLDDPQIDFLLLHLPVPHPEGIYDRHTGQFTSDASSYLDNLVLADRCLAELMQRLRNSGQFDSSTIIVMGDHSWRTTLLWKNSAAWTREEELASQGRFDPRPAYIVKLRQQQTSSTPSVAFAARWTRDLMDALMAGRVTSKDELAAWVKQTTLAKAEDKR